MDAIIYSGSIEKDFDTRSTFDTFNDSKKIKEDDEIDDTIHSMENEILILLWIKKRKSQEDVDDMNTLPFALKRLAEPNHHRKFDISKVGYGNDVQRTIRQEINVDSNLIFDKTKTHNVNELTLHQFL